MGTSGGSPEGDGPSNLTSQGWKDDRVWTGSDPCYPIELFLELLEGESLLFNHDDARCDTFEFWRAFLKQE